MMPQLGVLSSIHPEAALEVFNKDCLIRLGTSINPILKGKVADGSLFNYSFKSKNKNYKGRLEAGRIEFLPMPYEPFDAILEPSANVDLGNGFGQMVETQVFGGEVGLMLDGRLNSSNGKIVIENKKILSDWYKKMKVYNL